MDYDAIMIGLACFLIAEVQAAGWHEDALV